MGHSAALTLQTAKEVEKAWERFVTGDNRYLSGPFVSLNVNMIPKELVASELFGYEEGTFVERVSANFGG
jgi:transcriptional regulator with AAA-type ATPase domain